MEHLESERPSVVQSSRTLASTGPGELSPIPIPTPDGPAYARGVIRDLAVVYQNGDEHAENVELHLLPSRKMLLAFRAGGTGQAETGTARIRIFHFDPHRPRRHAGQRGRPSSERSGPRDPGSRAPGARAECPAGGRSSHPEAVGWVYGVTEMLAVDEFPSESWTPTTSVTSGMGPAL
jgi:hypothetical protein